MTDGLNLSLAGLNELAGTIYEMNKAKGFYEKPTEIGTRLALIHSEVSEALEADRKLRYFDEPVADAVLDLEKDEVFQAAFKSRIKDTFQDEIADAVIRLLDLCGYLKIDIQGHVAAKLRYNSLRPYKHGKEY